MENCLTTTAEGFPQLPSLAAYLLTDEWNQVWKQPTFPEASFFFFFFLIYISRDSDPYTDHSASTKSSEML